MAARGGIVAFAPLTLIQLAVLAAGVVNDLKSRKVKNWLSLSLAIACFLAAIVFNGLNQGTFTTMALSFGTALGMTFPLVFARMFGAGDMKLMLAFSLASTASDVFYILIYSLIWGAILGIFQAVLAKQGLQLLQNTYKLMTKDKPESEKLHRIPYTVALLFGWLTLQTISGGLL